MNSATKETNQIDWEDILSDLERHVKAYRENLFVAEELNPIVFVWSETGKTPMPNPTVHPNDLETWNRALENVEQAQQRIIKFEKAFNKILPPGKVVTAATLARYARPGVTPESLAMALGVNEGDQNEYPLRVSIDVAKRLADFWRMKKSLPILQHYTQSKGSFGTDNGMRMRWNAAHNYMHPTTISGNWDELPKQEKFAILLATKIANPGKSKKEIVANKLYESQRGADKGGKATWTLFRWLRPAQEAYYQSERQSYIGRHGQEKARKEVARVEKERHAMVRGDIKPYALIDRYAHENVQQRTHASKQILQHGKKAEGVKDVSDNSPAIPIEGQHGLTPMPMHAGESSRLKIGRPSSTSHSAEASASEATPHTVEGYDLPSLFSALNEDKYKLGEGDEKKLQTGRTIKTGAWHRLFQDAKGEGIEIGGEVRPLDAKEREDWDKAAARIAVDQGALHSMGDFDRLSTAVQDRFRKKVLRKLVANKHQTTTDMKGRTVWLHGTPEMRSAMDRERRDASAEASKLDPQRAERVARIQARKERQVSGGSAITDDPDAPPSRRRRTGSSRRPPAPVRSTTSSLQEQQSFSGKGVITDDPDARPARRRQATTSTGSQPTSLPTSTQNEEKRPSADLGRMPQTQATTRISAPRGPQPTQASSRGRFRARQSAPPRRERPSSEFALRRQPANEEQAKNAVLQVFKEKLESSPQRAAIPTRIEEAVRKTKQKMTQEFNDQVQTFAPRSGGRPGRVYQRLLSLSEKQNLEDIKFRDFDEVTSFIEQYEAKYGKDLFTESMSSRFGKRIAQVESQVRETAERTARAGAERAAITAGIRRGLSADQVRELLPQEELSSPVFSAPAGPTPSAEVSSEQIKRTALARFRRVTTERNLLREQNSAKYGDMTDEQIDSYLREASPEEVSRMSGIEKRLRSQIAGLESAKSDLRNLGFEINPEGIKNNRKGSIQQINLEAKTIPDDAAERIILFTEMSRLENNMPELPDEEYEKWAETEKEHLLSEYNEYSKRVENPSLSGFGKYLANQVRGGRRSREERMRANFLSAGLSRYLSEQAQQKEPEDPEEPEKTTEESASKSIARFNAHEIIKKANNSSSLVESVFRREKDKYDQMIEKYDEDTEKARIKSSNMRDRTVAIAERHGVQSPQHRRAMEEYADALSEYEVLIGQRPKIPTRNSVAQALMRQGVEKGGRASMLMLPIAVRAEHPTQTLLKRIDMAIARSFTR